MTEKGYFGDDPADLALSRAVKALESEIQPERDLWAGIERRIAESPQKNRGMLAEHWMPVGVAASLVVAVTSLVLNLTQPQGLQGLTFEPQSVEQGIDSINNQYRQVTSPMAQNFGEINKSLDPETLNELFRNLAIIEQARKDIEAQVRANPENPKLIEMLMWIHRKEVELLKQDFTSPIHTI